MSLRVRMALILSVAAFAACDNDLQPGWNIERTRLLGVAVESLVRPGTSSVQPGEDVRLTLHFASPAGPSEATYMLFACEPGGIDPRRGPLCGSEPVLIERSRARMDAHPLVFSLAPDVGSDVLLVQGIVCQPSVDPESLVPEADGRVSEEACEDDGLGTAFSLRLDLEPQGTPNQIPTLAPNFVHLDDDLWPSEGACGEANEFPVEADATYTLRFAAPDDEARETFAGERERWLISHFATDGELERQFSFIDDTTPEPTLSWNTKGIPLQAGEERTLVFHFVVRDGRGGLSRITRSVCMQAVR